ncbi:hypothetical protein [Flindersiella endophytica]
MKSNRKRLALGVAGLGLLGVLAGGIGPAQATSGPAEPPSPTATSATLPCPGMGTGTMMQGAPMTAAAKYLGLSLDQLQSRLRAGSSLADIAKEQGKSTAGLKNAMIAAMKKSLDANTTLTQAQKDRMLEQMKSRLDAMVSGAHRSGGMNGMMGNGRMGSGMWR